jgi:excisionase family DNA binding protein
LTCREVAARYNVKVGTVWGWIRDGTLAAYKIGKLYRVSLQHLAEMEQRNGKAEG